MSFEDESEKKSPQADDVGMEYHPEEIRDAEIPFARIIEDIDSESDDETSNRKQLMKKRSPSKKKTPPRMFKPLKVFDIETQKTTEITRFLQTHSVCFNRLIPKVKVDQATQVQIDDNAISKVNSFIRERFNKVV